VRCSVVPRLAIKRSAAIQRCAAGDGRRTMRHASIVALEIHNRRIKPAGKYVLHALRCVRLCVNAPPCICGLARSAKILLMREAKKRPPGTVLEAQVYLVGSRAIQLIHLTSVTTVVKTGGSPFVVRHLVDAFWR